MRQRQTDQPVGNWAGHGSGHSAGGPQTRGEAPSLVGHPGTAEGSHSQAPSCNQAARVTETVRGAGRSRAAGAPPRGRAPSAPVWTTRRTPAAGVPVPPLPPPDVCPQQKRTRTAVLGWPPRSSKPETAQMLARDRMGKSPWSVRGMLTSAVESGGTDAVREAKSSPRHVA